MKWVNPSQQPNTHTVACSLVSPAGCGENRRKARKLMDRDNDSLTGEIQAVHTRKA